MQIVDPGQSFADWRVVARKLLGAGIEPTAVLWEAQEDSLFGDSALLASTASAPAVPASFIALAESVSCHADPRRWAVLYQLLWRITRGGERHLLEIASDPDVAQARQFEKAVRREVHKMHAFVRFRLIEGSEHDARERYAAWFEPDHSIVRAAAPFFRKRFANMDWSIFTPKGCAHWLDGALSFTEGMARDPHGVGDPLEDAWRTYYRSIFNPARLKMRMMRSEMPQRYWKNLPEADLIAELAKTSTQRTHAMMGAEMRPALPSPRSSYLAGLQELSRPLEHSASSDTDWAEMARMIQHCKRCPLWEKATCGVAGEGPDDAEIMIVGEQPGDREDLEGRPFVGPAGKLLDQAMAAAGLAPSKAYITNAVKHFKWTPRGKLRLHQTPTAEEIDACAPWLQAELSKIAPRVLILLGRTAACSLLGPRLGASIERGRIEAPHLAGNVIFTVHPSYLLRIDPSERACEMERFVAELTLARDSDSPALPPARS